MSRKQWIGAVTLALMVAAVEVCVYLTQRWLDAQPKEELLVFQPEREEAFLAYLDSLRETERTARYAAYASRRDTIPIHLQAFDPNTADSTLLVTVGLKPWMAKSLVRYRAAGKVFRQKGDLRRLYGMNDSLYAVLEPYIRIDSAYIDSLYGGQAADTLRFAHHEKRDTILELNNADTVELQLLRGIGRYTAVQIVRYRQALGGYYALHQLYEIDGLAPERVDSIVAHLTVDSTRITPIAVNRASVKRLQRHPYISYRQAEQVYDLRRRRLRLNSVAELADIFTPDELNRLRPYLLFTTE